MKLKIVTTQTSTWRASPSRHNIGLTGSPVSDKRDRRKLNCLKTSSINLKCIHIYKSNTKYSVKKLQIQSHVSTY